MICQKGTKIQKVHSIVKSGKSGPNQNSHKIHERTKWSVTQKKTKHIEITILHQKCKNRQKYTGPQKSAHKKNALTHLAAILFVETHNFYDQRTNLFQFEKRVAKNC